MTLANLVSFFLAVFLDHGARHVVHHSDGVNAWMASRHYVVAVCHIPRTFVHGAYHCTATIRR